MRGEGEIPRIVDRLLSLPAEHDGLLAVVLAGRGAAAETREGAHVAVHQREQVDRAEGVEELPLGENQDVREQLHDLFASIGVGPAVGRPTVGAMAQARCTECRKSMRVGFPTISIGVSFFP
jgi:hypothetical protein